MATSKRRRKSVVTNAELLQKFKEVRANFRALLEPQGESWEDFCQRSQAMLYETTIRVWEEARSRSEGTAPAPPDPPVKNAAR